MDNLEKLEHILNTLKWQLIARLPNGSITNRVTSSMSNSNLDGTDPFYYIYWLDINRSLLKKYVLGTFKTINADYIPFINWLDNNYRIDNFYSINIDGYKIKIPRPKFEDYKCFKAEFLDIIMPSLTGDKDNIPYLEGPYEINDIKLEEGDTVLDLGANYGLFSSLASGKNCTVYAFEPTEEVVYKYLSHLEELDKNIHVIQKAVSSHTGTSYFLKNPTAPSCNTLTLKDDISNPNIVSISTTTVDDFVSSSSLNSVDFIKADIEGSERLMLEGAKQTIQEYAPKLSICYYHCFDDLKVLTKLIKDLNPHYDITVKYKKIYAKDHRK